MIQKLVRLVVMCFCLGGLLIQETQARNVYNLKGTLSVLPPELQESSVLHGAIAFETGMARRLYEDGPLSKEPEGRPERPPENAGEEVKEVYKTEMIAYNKKYGEWLLKCDPVVQLARNFFYMVPGSALLRLPEIFETIDQITFAQAMGVLIASMWWYMWSVESGIGSPANFAGFLIKDVKKTFETTLSLDGFDQTVILRSIRDTQWGNKLPLLVVLAAVWFKCGNDSNALKIYYKTLIDTVKQKFEYSKKLLQGAQNANQKRLDDPTISQPDRNETEEKEKKYQEMHGKIESIIHNLPQWSSPDDWRKTEFVFAEKEAIEKGVKALRPGDFKKTSLMAAENYEKLVFYRFGAQTCPLDIGHLRDFVIENEQGVKGSSFADCFETAIRSLINHLAYNPETCKLTVDCLIHSLKGREPLQSVKDFYEEHNDPMGMSEKKVHRDWLSIISGIPWVMYACGGTFKVLIPDDVEIKDRERYIRLCQDWAQGYHNILFVGSREKQLLYELVPDLRNFIIVMDYLLNLGLFAGKNIVDEFCLESQVFTERYLPQVFAAINHVEFVKRDGSFLYIKKIKDPEMPRSGEYNMKFKIEPSHAELTVDSKEDLTTFLKKFLFVNDKISHAQLDFLPYTFSMLLSFWQYRALFLMGYLDMGAFWAQNIVDSEKLFSLMGYDVNVPWEKEGINIVAFNEQRGKILLFLTNKISDAAMRNTAFFIISKIILDHWCDDLYEQVFNGIRKRIEMQDIESWWLDQPDKLLILLFNKGFYCDEIKKIACDFLNSEYERSFRLSLSLFEAFVEKDCLLDKAVDAAYCGMQGEFYSVRRQACQLFESLFSKNLGFPEAIKAAKVCFLNTDNKEQQRSAASGTSGPSCQDSAMELFEMLFKYGQGFREARELLDIPQLPILHPALKKLRKLLDKHGNRQ